MRIARVIGTVTLNRKLPCLRPGPLLIVDALDPDALNGHRESAKRGQPMPESLVAYDDLGAAVGQLVALSEGGEATQPFRPERVPVDAYCAAILDHVSLD